MNVSILYTPRTFDFYPNFNWILIADISMKWRNVHYIGYSIWNLVDFQVDGRGDSKPN